VRDPTGRARIIGEMRSGVRRTLNAQLGPFNVVIGDVNAASLTINGTAYDLSRHARGKVARFTLDPSQM
jgi:cytoskeleton protein RodZ